ncbi:S46 family peptidase [Oleiharenicola lentus]|uniref:S46 family peptidase n=1 Tax=Oleiharenicola lentus TaxID=2508720 RepID=UPI003F66C64B
MFSLSVLNRCAALVFASLAALSLHADDGMWLLNKAPLTDLKSRYGFEPSASWLEHVQKSAVRFNNGGSGSFASADGLIVTNHHVAHDAIYKLSTKEKDFVKDGFYAKTRAEELKCVDLELNVLMSIEDVTEKLNAAVKPGMSASEAQSARNTAKAAIEQESLAKTGLRSDIVTLYQGAQYHLYCYKRYTDVRLVWAPEEQAAFFGGDPDNFEFPRYDLDVTVVRAYENGVPAKVEHFLTWNSAGVKEGDLVFLAGHPGATQRLITLAELEYARDTQLPYSLRSLKSREVLLNSYAKTGPEASRRAQDGLRGIENSRKVFDGRIAGLLDPQLFTDKKAEEEALKKFAQDKPEFDAADSWQKIETAQQVIAQHATRAALLAGYNLSTSFSHVHASKLLSLARRLARAPAEFAKPQGDRLAEYRDAGKASFELSLFSAETIYPDLEQLELTHYLTFLAMELGANDPTVKAALGGKAPAVRAAELISGTKLADISFRKELYAMTPEQMAQVADPLIAFVRAVDGDALKIRKLIEQQNEIKEQAHAHIAKVRWAKDGDKLSPDATFTLRLSYGAVKGIEVAGAKIAPFTQLGGIFERSVEKLNTPPFDLPLSWPAKKEVMKLDTPFNFISTNYSIGGNSGSPTLNRAGEFVGIIFDGNIHTLVWNYAYSETQARSVSVDVRAILEAMRSIYGAGALADELLAHERMKP